MLLKEKISEENREVINNNDIERKEWEKEKKRQRAKEHKVNLLRKLVNIKDKEEKSKEKSKE